MTTVSSRLIEREEPIHWYAMSVPLQPRVEGKKTAG